MPRGSNTCRPTGNVVNTITYPCGECVNYLTRPGSNKAAMMQRLHSKACKKCDGSVGRLISTQLPTKGGSIGQVTKEITRDILKSGAGVRISTLYGQKTTPATHTYNVYVTQQLTERAQLPNACVIDDAPALV